MAKNRITQKILVKLANKWPDAHKEQPTYRMATCANCGRRMIRMWHYWLYTGGYLKEIHLCRKCQKTLSS